jgi:hypothetical protein
MSAGKNLDQATLRKLLRYDPQSGEFTWRDRRANRVKIGARAGSIDFKGYRTIKVQGRNYKAHRLAWLHMTGEWPHEIDHRNGEKADNRWSNLRLSNQSLNRQNMRRAYKNNQSGYLGVHVKGNKFQAKIKVNGVERSLGYFASATACHNAYLKAKRELHPGCTI